MANSPKKNQIQYSNYDENSKPSLDDFINSSKVAKRRKWFIWARKQRPSATKTVPLDAPTTTMPPEKRRRSWSCKDVSNMVIKRDNNKKKEKYISQPLVDDHLNSVESPEPKSTKVAQKPKTRSTIDKHIILGHKKSTLKMTSLDPIEKATCQENPPPLDRKITTTTASINNALVHSSSLPLGYSKGKKLATANSDGDPPRTATKKSKDSVVVVSRVDSVIGMSVILVMLLIMLMWGKVCAILCTSAWFYFVPRFRVKKELSKANKMDISSSIVEQIDINSQEYKKKVVLEGLLDRNKHRKNVVYSPK